MSGWNVVFFRSANNQCPYQKFFNSLEAEDRVRVNNKLKLLRQHGPQAVDTVPLDHGIFEIRVFLQNKTVRLFFFYQPNQTVVITHGICKKRQQAKRADIEQAMQYMGEHLTREE